MRLGVAAAIVDGQTIKGDVRVSDGRVVDVGLPSRGWGTAAPGFVDLQVNGFAGLDLLNCGAQDHQTIATALLRTGVTSYQPTLITSTRDDLLRTMNELGAARLSTTGARVLGVHLEGPFLALSRVGTHPPELVRLPEMEWLAPLLETGLVRQVTLAPELPGAVDVISALHGRGIVVSCGHSDATAEQAARAFDAGASTVTHLFNAMQPLVAREPGLAGVALARDDIRVQIIGDGVHVAREMLLMAFRAARGRVALATDAIAAAGGGEGLFILGRVGVEVRGREARSAGGNLAGAVGTMDEAVRQVIAWGISPVEAIGAASRVPAAICRSPDLGTLRPGAVADAVILDDRFEVSRVMSRGSWVEV